ncbi:hypothetical protein, partial [Bradyrhizobium sp. SZCCHNRI3052]|uniref:hypothetical protein n=1 Tax=Bradyrhizobium sp. SZCCHNRI3052 TaxID=3057295 RepID=UPI0029160197
MIDLEKQFLALVAELDGGVGNLAQCDEYLTTRDEAVLARLDPVERAIMETPAYTMMGLSVKARHLAHVLSEYWEAPIELPPKFHPAEFRVRVGCTPSGAGGA